jgi:hypothetical protein
MKRQSFLVSLVVALAGCGAPAGTPEAVEVPVFAWELTEPPRGLQLAEADYTEGSGALVATADASLGARPLLHEKEEGYLGEGVELRDEYYVQTLTLQAEEAGMYQFSLYSGDFDTALRVRLGSGREIYNDDAGDGSTNSRVRIQVDEPQEIIVEITSYAARTQGNWQLLTQQVVPGEGGRILAAEDTELSIAAGEAGSNMFWMEMHAGESMLVRVTSPEFDTTLEVVSPEGLVWFNDDANDTGPDGTEQATDSTLDFVAPVSGWYQMTIRAYGGGPLGAWHLVRHVRPPVRLVEGQ